MGNNIIKRKTYSTYYIFIAYFSLFLILSLFLDNPSNILDGLVKIFFDSNILITDYIALGGIGAALFNSSLLSIIFLIIFIYVGIKPNGSTISCILLVFGFGLFGKNLLNVWPIVFGVWLYSKYQKKPFINYILIATFGTTLAPTFNELLFTNIFPFYIALPFSLLITTTLGFLLSPISTYCLQLHKGYNLYNTGFAAGLIGTVLMGLLRSFGIDFKSRLLWSTEYTTLISIVLFTMFTSFIIIGFVQDKKAFIKLFGLMKLPGKLVSDFYTIFGSGTTFVNMGILGIVFTTIILLLSGDLSGPTIGGIFSVVGFGSFGKHLKNSLPVAIGAIICAYLNIWPVNSPSMIMAILFSTTLAPLSGEFGWPFGIIAGFTHVSMVMNMGNLHGGLNLYNNGFAGGIVTIILLPLFLAFKEHIVSPIINVTSTVDAIEVDFAPQDKDNLSFNPLDNGL